MAGKIMLFVMVAALCVLVLLSFLAPTESEKPFWRTIQKLRNGVDAVSYWIINLIAIAMILLVIYAIIKSLMN